MKNIAIRENHLYSKAYSGGKRATSRSVTVYVLKDRSAGRLQRANPLKTKINRVGISASKKIGGAVQRNRAKRVIREAYREIDRETGIRTGFLVVIAARAPAPDAKMQDVKRDLQFCLSRIDMLTKKAGGDAPCQPSSKQET